MNFRRSKPREKGARGNSSDWSYIRLEKGNKSRSRASVRRFMEKAKASIREWVR
jgi:hypothetical protein